MKYRLYVDEVGNADLESSTNPNERYLSLTGVAIELEYAGDVLHSEMESLKRRYFKHHPDEPLILHRKELANKKYPFKALQDSEVEARFNADLLDRLTNWRYRIITVTIDKLEHIQRYKTWRYDAYHYCLKVLLERYIQWLDRMESTGDVIAEARGTKADTRLKESFTRVYEGGSDYVSPEMFKDRLTSSQLKVKPKVNNISGLQLADLIAYPSYKAALARKQKQALPENFSGSIAQILENGKYYCSPSGNIEGWGRKWLP